MVEARFKGRQAGYWLDLSRIGELNTLELTATHLSFEGRQFGGPGTGVGVSNEKIDWVPDADRSECALCRKPFSGLFKTGKHHCRACGDIYCAACSDYKKPLPRLGLCEPVRVCATCFTDSGTLQRGRRRHQMAQSPGDCTKHSSAPPRSATF